MAQFQFNIAVSSVNETYKKTITDDPEKGISTASLIGKKIGEIIEGSSFGFDGYEFKITGGSAEDGCPMHPHVPGSAPKKILSAGGLGYKNKRAGKRRRKRVIGNTISDRIFQINLVLVKQGSRPIEELV
ncbi:MAG: S6e family ribosomal protein [Candidatus Hodarchaeota archaeon]